MSKKNTRFIFHSKEAEIKDGKLKKRIILTVLISAVLAPLFTEGVLYVVMQYIDGDISLDALHAVLRYLVVFLRYAAFFVSYGAVAVGLVNYGYVKFKAPVLLLVLGSAVFYLVAQYGSYLFCCNNDLLILESEAEIYESAFHYFFLTVYSIVKNVVLSVICLKYVKRLRKNDTELTFPDESMKSSASGFGGFMKTALDKNSVYRRICVYAALFELVFSFTVQFLSETVYELYAAGLPENIEQVWILTKSYVLITAACAAGFFVMAAVCLILSLQKPEKKL